jgi:hypothetical protein
MDILAAMAPVPSKKPSPPVLADLEDLAARFLDLWQTNIAAWACDERMAEALAPPPPEEKDDGEK